MISPWISSNMHIKHNMKINRYKFRIKKELTLALGFPLILIHLLMNPIKHRNEELMRVLLLITRQIRGVLPPTTALPQQQISKNPKNQTIFSPSLHPWPPTLWLKCDLYRLQTCTRTLRGYKASAPLKKPQKTWRPCRRPSTRAQRSCSRHHQ